MGSLLDRKLTGSAETAEQSGRLLQARDAERASGWTGPMLRRAFYGIGFRASLRLRILGPWASVYVYWVFTGRVLELWG